MSLADLTFDRWRALDRDAAHRPAPEAARSADGRLVEHPNAFGLRIARDVYESEASSVSGPSSTSAERGAPSRPA
ncbi:hypothetical protein [Streptomyces niveus]